MPLGPKDSNDWVSPVSKCPDTSVSVLAGKSFLSSSSRRIEDRYETDVKGDVKLYLVLDGHDGAKASNFVNKHLPQRVLSNKLSGSSRDAIVVMLQEAFLITDKRFFEDMDNLLAHKGIIQADLKECTSAEAQTQFPRHVERLQEIEDAIRGGCTGVLALVVDKNLYIASLGNCRALLCSLDGKRNLTVTQVTEDHNVRSELSRLESSGLNREMLQDTGSLGPYESTRCFGDYQLKYGYSDIDFLKSAKQPPGISDPTVIGPFSLEKICPNSFLLLMSGGVLKNVACLPQDKGVTVNEVLARLVAKELCATSNLKDVSAKVLALLAQEMEVLQRADTGSQTSLTSIEDMTMMVCNFGFPLGKPSSTPVAYFSATANVMEEPLSGSDVEFDSEEEFGDHDDIGFDPRKVANGVEAYVKFDHLPPNLEYSIVV